MKVFVLLLLLTLVGCQDLNSKPAISGPVFSRNKCYTYKYELKQVTRVAGEWYSGVGIKLVSKVVICGSRSELLLIKMDSPEVYEYRSNSPRPEFIRSPELTNSFAAKLGKHVAFRLENGRIQKIMAPANHSVDGLNIYKGFINIMQLTIKDKMRDYILSENGIEGLCNTTYTISDSKKANRMLVMKSKNLNDCLNRVEKVVGATYTTPCPECKEKKSQAGITSSYFLKPTQEGFVIDQVDVAETHQYMPFNGMNGGSIVMEARQNIQLIKVEQHSPEMLPTNMEECKSLALQFSDDSQQLTTPVKQLEHQIMDDLQYLTQHMWENLSKDCARKFQRLTQNMHKADYELYESVYKKCSSQSACRRIFWDVIASADSPNGIRLLKHKYEQQEITSLEAAQIVIISFHYSSPSLEVIEEAKSFLRAVHKHPHDYLFRISLLAYASLCHRHCVDLNKCPDSVLKPVKDFANEVLSKPNEDDIILLLRAYENLQHQSIMKSILKFLPGFATSPLTLRIQQIAMLCLKGFANKDPTWVRRTSMHIFLNKQLPYSTRIVAVMSLLSAKPDLPALMILAKSLDNEPSAQVEHFVISSLTTLATSTAPDLRSVASASRMALNVVSSKYEEPKYAAGKFFLLSFYKESLMTGVTTEVFILNNIGSIFPNFMSARFDANILGTKFSPLEVGVGIRNFAEFLQKRYEADHDSDRSFDARKHLKMQSDQKMMPHDSPIVGGYVQMFGQNIITGTANVKTIMEAYKELYSLERSDSWISNLIHRLQRGAPIQWVKALTSVDASYAVAVGTGLPMERSLTHVAITSLAGNAKVWFTPELPQNPDLFRLNLTDIRLKTDLSLSMDKHMIFRMGIQNSLVQTGLEEYAKMTVKLPVKSADVAVNFKDKSFKLEFPPCKEETDIFSLSGRTFAVVGNGEEEPTITPILPPVKVPNIMDWKFQPDSVSDNKLKERKYSKTNSPRSTHLAEPCGHHSAPLLGYLNASTFGFQTCLRYSAEHAGLNNAILNRIVGDHNITCTMYPVHSEPPIKAIQVIVQLGEAHQLGYPKTEKLKTRIQNKYSSSESISSDSSRNTDEDNEERPLDGFSSQEAQTRHGKSPKKLQNREHSSRPSGSSSGSSSSSSSSSGSSSSSSSSSSGSGSSRSSSSRSRSRRSSSGGSSSSGSSSSRTSRTSSSTSSSESSNRNSSEYVPQQGRQENRKHGRRSSSDHGDVEREHSRTPGKQQSSKHEDIDENAWLNQKEKRKTRPSVIRSSKTSQKYRTRDKNDSSEGGAAQEKTSRASSSSESSSSRKDESSSSSSSSKSSKSRRDRNRRGSESSCSSSERSCRSSGSSSSSSGSSSSSSSSRSRSRSRSSSRSSSSSSSSSSASSSSEETNFLADRVPPSLTFVAQAIRNNNKKQGYEAKVYIEKEPNKLDMQLVMGDLGENKRSICLYVDVWPYKAQASLSMENQCRYKNLEIEVSKGHLARNPAVQVKIKSKKPTKMLKDSASMAEEVLPNLASQYGFNSICQNNPSDELVVGVAVSSPQSVFVICKLPEETLYKEDLNIPWTSIAVPPQHYPSKELTSFNFFTELTSRIFRDDEAVCQVEETSIRTFDNMRFNGSFNENCRTLIAQECTEKPQFSIMTRKLKLDLPREVYIHLTSANITISPSSTSSLLVLYNGEPIEKDMFEDDRDITIYRNESTVFIKAPQHGLENVTYDCEMLWVRVSSWMRGKTCGLCGSNDGEKQNEGHMPNHELANNDMAFFHSWLLEDSGCATGLNSEERLDQSSEEYSIME
ncbi:vitellogenin-1-like isoform X3 [Paroedura picta]|uniref:vitellogenin-1-like isoform X3 n=1 Tax=Paroedura picta TaxID=143630 RepID=UPI0040559CBC